MNNLRSRCLLEYFEEYEITENVEFNDGTVREISRVATDDEVEIIINIKHQVMQSLGCTKMWQIYFYDKTKDFYNKVNNIQLTQYGWKSVFKRYKVIFNRKNMANDMPLVEKEIKEKLARSELNEKIYNNVNEQAEYKYNQFQEEIRKENSSGWGTPNPMKKYSQTKRSIDIHTYTDTYLLAQRELSDYFLRLQVKR